jgi:hypothetical protein
MLCDDVRAALVRFDECEDTSDGSRVPTHCLYPSFEAVTVYVAKIGNGYRVHDGRGAYESAWLHGRNDAVINRALRDECARFHLEISDKAIFASVSTLDWLASAIMSVANASASAANAAVAKVRAIAEEALFDKIDRTLGDVFDMKKIGRHVQITGKSGGQRNFDFVIHSAHSELLINGVIPHSSSVSSKYVSFSDTEIDRSHKMAVIDKSLDTEDAALLQQVASIVPLGSLREGARRIFSK